ncbi:hypothetical protein EH230_14075 [Flavobacterium columnare]|uniref:Teneurin-like YD-shell domain-containing protein n=1 Tax=Flavobacterium columnare TaxID=996 RepID=A0A437U8E2_9FLAO|nr:RHS repeat-associated core domain-containing protein [Flavobacterium columnare]RVU89884.1 hypothetical protein EH230_14075 [Flavobacterium columnare]
MKKITILLALIWGILSYSQTILNKTEGSKRTVEDPNIVILAPGFYANSNVVDPFVAKIGTATSGGAVYSGTTSSEAGAGNPSGMTFDSTNFHDTKGTIDVDAGGQLTYTLPIALPPGVKSVAPQMNLVYNSGSGNGIAGYGWNLTGISSISRVGRNIEKDGEVKGVQFDYSDYYSFNGQRLLLKSGTYGKDGAEYVTEKYSNMRIKSVGDSGGIGPEYWEVTFEDGSQAWYGKRGDIALAEYNISKWKDAQGNYITYSYDQTSSVKNLKTIEWGGNEFLGKAHFNSMIFNYVSRSTEEYIENQRGVYIQKKLLSNVVVNSNGNLFKKYLIGYNKDVSRLYDRVESITEYNSKNIAANPVSFIYETSNKSVWKEQNVIDKDANKIVGDFDGDGVLDYMKYYSTFEDCVEIIEVTHECKSVTKYNGIKLFNSLVEGSTDSKLVMSGTLPFTVDEFKKAIPISFVNKDNIVSKKQGILIRKEVLKTPTLKKDQVFEIYSIENNILTFQYSKTLSADIYDQSQEWSYTDPYTGETISTNNVKTKVNQVKEFDLDGDGSSELVLSVQHDHFVEYFYPCDDQIPFQYTSDMRPNPNWNRNKCVDTQRYSDFDTIVFDLKSSVSGVNSLTILGIDKDILNTKMSGDFDGDGKIDFINLRNGGIQISNFSRNKTTLQFEINTKPYNSLVSNLNGDLSEIRVGDINGDGKSDLLIPQESKTFNWYVYLSNGKGFVPIPMLNTGVYFEKFDYCKCYFEKEVVLSDNYHNREYYLVDLDADGKSELVYLNALLKSKIRVGINQSLTQLEVYKFKAIGDNLSLSFVKDHYDFWREDEVLKSYSLLINNNVKKGTTDLILGAFDESTKTSSVKAMSYYNIPKSVRVNAILQGGIETKITFEKMDGLNNSDIYINDGEKFYYPFVSFDKVDKHYVVSQLEQVGRIQNFKYADLVGHLQGRGTVGFRKVARSSWYSKGFEGTRVWSVVESDPLLWAMPKKEWSTRDISIFSGKNVDENTTNILSFKKIDYDFKKLVNNVDVLLPIKVYEKDFLKSTIGITTTIYNSYYLPKEQSQSITGLSNHKTILEYIHNDTGLGKDYYVGRLLSKQEEVTAYGDTKKSKTEFGYANNLLTTQKTYNQDESQYILDTYTYDGFGNVTSKTISNSTDSQTRTESATYDDKGRFVLKKKDALGLESEFTYNDWGQVLSQKNPLGITESFVYDTWGKILKSYHPLQGYTNYTYKRQDGDAVVAKYLPDGQQQSVYTNTKGEVLQEDSKGLRLDSFIGKSTRYDVLGRKVAESNPFVFDEDTPKWNRISYDDSVFPAKVTVSSANGKVVTTKVEGMTTEVTEVNGYQRVTQKVQDALGNLVSSTDKGGTITYNYNAVGQVVSANYGKNAVRTTYDNWGRKASFHDPANGEYTYEYNGLGQMTKEISPKGNKTYEYNTLGQLIRQKENSKDGVSTKKDIQFSYDTYGRLTQVNGVCNGMPYGKRFVFDAQGRLIESGESANDRYFMQKNIKYDDAGRILSYEKGLYSGGTYTKAVLEHEYGWNGALVAIKDKATQKTLWRLGDVNAKGQVLGATLGAIAISNTYDSNDFLSSAKHNLYLQGQSPVSVLELGYSFDAIKNELKNRSRNGSFGTLKENFVYDDNNRLINWTNLKTGSMSYNTYDEKGRITENDQLGKVNFKNPDQVYQNTSIDLNATGLEIYPDADTALQFISYNENNDPLYIDGKKGDYAFGYGLTESRQVMHYGGNFSLDQAATTAKFTKYYSEDGSFEVVRDNTTGQEKHLLYIGGTPYESNIVYVKNYAEIDAKPLFLHKDYLGTILAITDEKGKLVEERHFDAWGNLTHGSMQVLDRGYTSHEHLQDVGLIHMNGRLYDPMLRRFLNADENIQDPTNTQCYNKYGYVMNNPLMFSDPDGEIAIAIVVVGAVVGAYFAAAQANGTYNPLKWNWSSSATWESMVFGGAIGAISSVVGGWAGPYLSGVIAPSAGGFFGGALSAGLGGLAGGFVSGSLGSLVFGGGNPIVDGLRSAAFGFVAGGLIGGVSQGISSSLKGGNFWTGKMPPVEVLSSSLQPQGLQPLQGATLEATDIEIPKPAAVSNGQSSNSLVKQAYKSSPRVITQKSTINPFDEGKGLRSMRIPRVEMSETPVNDFVRVRHHTSSMGLKGIKNSGFINASRTMPYGVDVEFAPFLKPTNVNLGQAGRGSFIEFSISRSQMITPPPGYMGGVGNAGRIVTEGTPLNIQNANPSFVRWNWWPF